MTTGYPQDPCTRCYEVGGTVVPCPGCSIERIAAMPGDRERLYDAFDRHARRMLDFELDEAVRAHTRGMIVKPRRIWPATPGVAHDRRARPNQRA